MFEFNEMHIDDTLIHSIVFFLSLLIEKTILSTFAFTELLIGIEHAHGMSMHVT